MNHLSKPTHALRFTILFFLALLPRAYDLGRFVTADEAKWLYRSAQFLAACLRGDFSATSVNLTPAVTTTWLGSVGLMIYYQLHQAAIGTPLSDWLISLPEFRVQVEVLVAARWPMVIFTSLGVGVIYLLAARLFNPTVAFIGAIFLALDPHSVSLARVLGHDAPAATFMTISLLLLLNSFFGHGVQSEALPYSKVSIRYTLDSKEPFLLFTSGVTAGLAFLSKAPTLFLIPFAVLLFLGFSDKLRGFVAQTSVCAGQTEVCPTFAVDVIKPYLFWLMTAYLTFVIIWPSAWLQPLGRPYAVVENAFFSATDQEEADAEGYWLVPDLGLLYYLVNGAYKLSPLVMVGVGFYLVMLTRHRSSSTRHAQWLLTFAILFTIFMTLGDKRSPRYLLPIFPALALVAACGWQWLINRFTIYKLRLTAYGLLSVTAMLMLFPYTPYYFTYFNPLLGGAYTAPHFIKIGWGEGLDQVGRFLQRQLATQPKMRVGTTYSSTVAAYFSGKLSGLNGQKLDYVVLYRKHVQSGSPSPAFIRYFEHFPPVFTVDLNGLHYADVYVGPTLTSAKTTDGAMAFRLLKDSVSLSHSLAIDVLWSPETANLPTSATVTIHLTQTPQVTPDSPQVLAVGQAELTRWADELMVSRHKLVLPTNLIAGKYLLQINGQFLGEIELP